MSDGIHLFVTAVQVPASLDRQDTPLQLASVPTRLALLIDAICLAFDFTTPATQFSFYPNASMHPSP